MGELDCKLQGIEEEIESVRKVSQKDICAVTEQISSVETPLAQDIETERGHIEEKFEETKKHQLLAEDRLQEVTVGLERENEKFKVELEDLRATIERLQQPSNKTCGRYFFFFFFFSEIRTYNTASKPRLYIAGLPECRLDCEHRFKRIS